MKKHHARQVNISEALALSGADVDPAPERKLTSTDPEPGVGAVVMDACGMVWKRVPQPLGGTYWRIVTDATADPESWIKVAGNYGPVEVLYIP